VLEGLEEEVRRVLRGEGVSAEEVRRAVRTVMKEDGPYTREDVQTAARRARTIAGLPQPVVPPGPAAEILVDRIIPAAMSYVRQVRTELFGSPEAPFASAQDARAVAWLAGMMARQFDGNASDTDRAFQRAVAQLEEATGFRGAAVQQWILYDVTPKLHRATLRTTATRHILPDGKEVRRKFATYTINAPVTEAEFRRTWRMLDQFWKNQSSLGIAPGEASGAKRQRGEALTRLDQHLFQLHQRTPGATWEERRRRWHDEPPDGWSAGDWQRTHGNVRADALRIRWGRLKTKLDNLESNEERRDTPAKE
jgi:hypothetical protein